MSKRTKADLDALMAKLRKQQEDYAEALGFPIGCLVEFHKNWQKIEPGFRGQWVVTGVIQSMDRVELDTWPRTNTYTAVEAARVRFIRSKA